MTTKRNKTTINTQCIQIQICFLSVSCSCLPDIVNTDFIIWICILWFMWNVWRIICLTFLPRLKQRFVRPTISHKHRQQFAVLWPFAVRTNYSCFRLHLNNRYFSQSRYHAAGIVLHSWEIHCSARERVVLPSLLLSPAFHLGEKHRKEAGRGACGRKRYKTEKHSEKTQKHLSFECKFLENLYFYL